MTAPSICGVGFLLGATWLAVNVWASEHVLLLATAAACAAQPWVRSRSRS